MKFKMFIAREDANSSEKGAFSHTPSKQRKPSDGIPFAKFMSNYTGGDSQGGGQPQAPMMMKKKMKKK